MSHAPSRALERRHDAVRRAVHDLSVEALVVTSLTNITYLTNFVGSAGIVVLLPGELCLLTDSRYTAAVDSLSRSSSQCPGLVPVLVEGSYDERLAEFLAARGLRTVGFEAAHL